MNNLTEVVTRNKIQTVNPERFCVTTELKFPSDLTFHVLRREWFSNDLLERVKD